MPTKKYGDSKDPSGQDISDTLSTLDALHDFIMDATDNRRAEANPFGGQILTYSQKERDLLFSLPTVAPFYRLEALQSLDVWLTKHDGMILGSFGHWILPMAAANHLRALILCTDEKSTSSIDPAMYEATIEAALSYPEWHQVIEVLLNNCFTLTPEQLARAIQRTPFQGPDLQRKIVKQMQYNNAALTAALQILDRDHRRAQRAKQNP